MNISLSDRVKQESADFLLPEELNQLQLEESSNTPESNLSSKHNTLGDTDPPSSPHATKKPPKGSKSLPVRYVNDFEIRDANTGQLITIDNIEDKKRDTSPYFTGMASSVLEDMDCDYDLKDENTSSSRGKGIFIRSSAIIEIWEATEETDREVNEER
jgi:hypothetical protein